MTSSDDKLSGEDRLIAHYFKPLASAAGAFGLADDAAVIAPPPGHELVVTTDGLIAGVHFFEGEEAGHVARKAFRVNLSDLVAKGALPVGYLLSLALPKQIDDAWLRLFADALQDDGDTCSCPLYGGDTDRTPGPLSVSITMFGSVPRGAMVRRAGAKPGDLVFVTGSIGDAALGLALRQGANWKLSDAERDHLLSRYRLPRVRLAMAEILRTHASAAMDVSDGLAGDLAKLCRVSQVATDVDVTRVPLSDAAKAVTAADPAMLEAALTGGDDYEIVCTVPPDNAESLRAAAKAADIALTQIGTIAAGEGVHFLSGGQPLRFKRAAFSHF